MPSLTIPAIARDPAVRSLNEALSFNNFLHLRVPLYALTSCLDALLVVMWQRHASLLSLPSDGVWMHTLDARARELFQDGTPVQPVAYSGAPTPPAAAPPGTVFACHGRDWSAQELRARLPSSCKLLVLMDMGYAPTPPGWLCGAPLSPTWLGCPVLVVTGMAHASVPGARASLQLWDPPVRTDPAAGSHTGGAWGEFLLSAHIARRWRCVWSELVHDAELQHGLAEGQHAAMHAWPGLLDERFVAASTKMDMVLTLMHRRNPNKGMLVVSSRRALARHAAAMVGIHCPGRRHNLAAMGAVRDADVPHHHVCPPDDVTRQGVALHHVHTDMVVAPSDLEVLPLLLAAAPRVLLLDAGVPDALLTDLWHAAHGNAKQRVTYVRTLPLPGWPCLESATLRGLFSIADDAAPSPAECSIVPESSPHLEWGNGHRTSLLWLSLDNLRHCAEGMGGAPAFRVRMGGLPLSPTALLDWAMLRAVMAAVGHAACEGIGNPADCCLDELGVLNSLSALPGADGSAVCTFLLCSAVLRAAGVPWLKPLALSPPQKNLIMYVLAVCTPHCAATVLGVHPVAAALCPLHGQHSRLDVGPHVYTAALRAFAGMLRPDALLSTHVIRRWLPCGDALALPAARLLQINT